METAMTALLPLFTEFNAHTPYILLYAVMILGASILFGIWIKKLNDHKDDSDSGM
ncbi:hypothetical protein [Paenibacillus campi]|uniref:hypothetical protein n=1 Tax=Paenibacillus campi TaxID=3106031 RepID=UPI002AFE310D|nr:hypothetical protein [Paenibacillus sp. SGZ-1014]